MKIVIVSEDKAFLKLAASILAVTGHDVMSTAGNAA
jgi:pilus assembly protein CpaE